MQLRVDVARRVDRARHDVRVTLRDRGRQLGGACDVSDRSAPSELAERMGEVQAQIEGLLFEWITIPADAPMTDRSIRDGELRTRTGASVVAVLRGEGSVPAPDPEFVFAAGPPEHTEVCSFLPAASSPTGQTECQAAPPLPNRPQLALPPT